MKNRKKNPRPIATIALIGVGVGAIALIGYMLSERDDKSKKKDDATKPEEYGLLLNATCTDFTVKNPPVTVDETKLPQSIAMEEVVQTAVQAGGDIDPFSMANTWFARISPSGCTWPPVSTSTPRIQSAYILIATLLAARAIDRGASVLGVTNETTGYNNTIDQKIVERAKQMGLTWNPDVIEDLAPSPLPPDMSGEAPLPDVTAASPSHFPQSSAVHTTTLVGDNLSADLDVMLRDEGTNASAEVIDVEPVLDDENEPVSTSVLVKFKTEHPGQYTVHLKQVQDDEWLVMPVTIRTTVSEAGLLV